MNVNEAFLNESSQLQRGDVFFFQGNKEHKIGSSDFVRCESGHVIVSNGQCRRVLPVTCNAEGDHHWPNWVLAAEISKAPGHCVRG